MIRPLSDPPPARPVLTIAAILAVAAVAQLATPPAPAQTVHTWTGADSSIFTDPANWDANGVPPTGDPATQNRRISVQNGVNQPLIYTAAQGTSIYAASGGGTSDRSLFIGSVGAGSMIIEGGTFDSRGVQPDGIANNSISSLTIDGGHYTNVNGGNTVFLVGFSQSAGQTTQGTLTINSGSFTSGAIQFGANNSAIATGIVNLNGGLLETGIIREGNDNNPAANVNATFNFNGGTLRARGDNGQFMQNLGAANILAGGATIDTQGFNITINQNLIGGVGDGGLTKQGSGTLVLGGNNTYTGDTTVTAGILRATTSQALGTSDGDVTVANNARLELSGGITIAAKDITIAGNGGDNLGALRSVSGSNTWTGNVTLAANNTRIGAIDAGQTLEISGAIGDNGAGHTLAIRSADGGGTVILGGQSTYGGDTHVVVGPVQLAGGDNRLPTGSVLRMGNTSNVASASFDLNGNNQTVAGLVSDGTGMSMVVTNSSATPATLTVNNSGGNTYNGVLSGNLALTKTGGGSLTLGGSAANNLINDYTGLTTVTGGTLFLNKGAGGQAIGGDILVNGGSLRYFSTTPAANQIAPTSNLTITSGNFNSSGFGPVDTARATETLASVTLTGGSFSSGSLGGIGGDFTITGATTVDRSGGINSIFTIGSGSVYHTHSLTVTDLNASPSGNNSQPNTFTVFGSSSAAQTTLHIGPGGLTLDNSQISLRMGGAGALGSRLILDGDLTATGGNQSILTADTTSGSSGTTLLELSSTAAPVTRIFHVDAGSTFATSVFVTNGASTEAGITMTGTGTLRFSGSRANTYTGLTTISGGGTFQMHSNTNVVSVAGDLLIENGSKVTFTNANQFASTSNITMSGASSVLNGTGVNTGQTNTAQQAASLAITGGTFNLGSGSVGWTIDGLSSFTGGSGGNTLFIGNSNGTMTTGGLTLTNMTATRGTGPLATPDSFTLYGASGDRVTTLTVGSAGLALDNSRINLRRGTGGQLGSRLILQGDVTTTGTSPSFISEDTAGGTAGLRDLQLDGTRTFNIGADAPLHIDVPITDASTAGGITKTGDGVLHIEGNATISGPTTIEAGTLNLAGSLTTASATIAAGGLLTGSGTLTTTGNSTLVSAGSVFAPGDPDMFGVGTFQLSTFSLTFEPGALWEVNIAGSQNGRLELDSPTTFDLTNVTLGAGGTSFDFVVNPLTPYWILNASGPGGVTGGFANMTTGGPVGLFPDADGFVTLGGTPFAVFLDSALDQNGNLTGGTGVVLFATPEPTRALLLVLAGACLLLHRRR